MHEDLHFVPKGLLVAAGNVVLVGIKTESIHERVIISIIVSSVR